MIRFIDLRHVEEDIQERFAFWDTGQNRFVIIDGEQAWSTAEELAEAPKRYKDLLPEWTQIPEYPKHSRLLITQVYKDTVLLSGLGEPVHWPVRLGAAIQGNRADVVKHGREEPVEVVRQVERDENVVVAGQDDPLANLLKPYRQDGTVILATRLNLRTLECTTYVPGLGEGGKETAHHLRWTRPLSAEGTAAWVKARPFLARVKAPFEHVLYECDGRCGGGLCHYCTGGLASCEVCGGAEGTLPTDCPGAPMSQVVQERVYQAQSDYVDGKWHTRQATEDQDQP